MAITGWLTRTVLTLGLAGSLLGAGMASQSAILNSTDLRKLGASANTAVQHRRLAAHYHMRAAEFDADAKAHDAIARLAGQRSSNDDEWDLARDARHYSEHARESAEASMELAELHEALAARSEK